MSDWDVIICGAGSAGIAAALGAARTGARTLLVERHSLPGGMGTQAMVHTFCGLFHPDVSRPWSWLNPGVPEEIGTRMMEATGQKQPDLMGRVHVLRQHPTLFARIADELLSSQPSLVRMTGLEWTALRQQQHGWTLEATGRGCHHTWHTHTLVDCTGDATGARLHGGSWLQARPQQLYRPAYVAAFQNVTHIADDTWRLNLGGRIVRAVQAGRLPASALGTGFRASPFPGEIFATVDLEAGQADWDPFDAAKRADIEAEGRTIMLALWQMLRTEHPDFSQCPPPTLPAQAGIRESACYAGDHVLTGDELAACTRFDDEVALAGWPMEKRETARGPKFRFFDRPEPAAIPARCLRRADAPGLFFAGRCLSADHEALASVRVMGTCMATGEAAGRMAAQHAAQLNNQA